MQIRMTKCLLLPNHIYIENAIDGMQLDCIPFFSSSDNII